MRLLRPIVAVLIVASCAPLWGQSDWISQGPDRIRFGQVEGISWNTVNGAVQVVRPHPTDPNTVFLGAVNGGIWRTTNGGATWAPLTDDQRSLSIGALEFDPTDPSNNTLIAGFASQSLSGVGGPSAGLLYSADGGDTWEPLGSRTFDGRNIVGLAARADLILAAVDRSEDGVVGLYRSVALQFVGPGVSNFERVSGTGGLPAGAVTSLVGDPGSSTRFFVAVQNQGLFRSEDNGITWTSVTDPLMNIPAGTSNILLATGAGGASLFAAIAGTNGRLASVWRSTDRGATWSNMGGLGPGPSLGLPGTMEGPTFIGIHPGAQADLHFSLTGHPTNGNLVFIGGDRQPAADEGDPNAPGPWPNSIGATAYTGRLFRGDASQAPGGQWTPLTHAGTLSSSAPHADSRSLAFDASGRLVQADDGGIYRRTLPDSAGGDWELLFTDGLRVTEFQSIAWDSVSWTLVGGTLDNGAIRQRPIQMNEWDTLIVGEGGTARVNDLTVAGSSVHYFDGENLQGFSRYRVDAAGNVTEGPTPADLQVGGQSLGDYAMSVGDGVPLFSRVVLNSVDPTRIAIGTHRVYTGMDDVANPFLPTLGLTDLNTDNFGDAVGGIAWGNATNPDQMLVGAGWDVYLSTTSLPGSLNRLATYDGDFVRDVALHPTDTNTLYVADPLRLHASDDGGVTWTSTLALREMMSVETAQSLAGAIVIVGGQGAVYAAYDGNLADWARLGNGLPNVPIADMEFDAAGDLLAVGTLGRGAWTLPDVLANFPVFPAPGQTDEGFVHVFQNGDGGQHTLNGGTIQVSESASVATDIALTGLGGWVDTTNSSGQLDGIISGPGGLTVMGNGSVVFSGQNTYQGGTVLEGGTLGILDNAGLGGPDGGLWFAGGTLTSVGGLELDRTVMVENLGGRFYDGGFNNTWRGDLAGTGELEKAGPGMLTYEGDGFAYLGVLSIREGTFQVAAGSTVLGLMNVRSPGALMGNGNVFDVWNAGNVAPGASVGTLNVLGNYVQTADGRLTIEVDSATSADLLQVTGAVQLDGTLVGVFNPGYTPAAGDRIVFLRGDTVDGTFATAPGGNITPTLILRVDYQEDEVAFVIQADFIDPNLIRSLSENQRAVAGMLEAVADTATGDLADMIEALTLLPDVPTLGAALNQWMPREYAIQTRGAWMSAGQQSRQVTQRLRDIRRGASGFDGGRYQLAGVDEAWVNRRALGLLAPPGGALDAIPGQGVPAIGASTDSRWGAFVAGNGFLGDRSDSSRQMGFEMTTAGATAGVDYRFDDAIAVGLLAGYSGTDADTDDSGGGVDSDLVTVGGFATLELGGAYADVLVAHGWSWHDQTRRIRFPGVDRTASSDTEGRQLLAYGGFGYDWTLGPWTLGPTTSLQYVDLRVDGYTEEDAGALNLVVDDMDTESLQTSAGVRIERRLETGAGVLRPSVRASWVHEFGDDGQAVRSRLVTGGASSFLTRANDPDRDFATAGANVRMDLECDVTLFVDYEAQVGQTDFIGHTLFGGFEVGF